MTQVNDDQKSRAVSGHDTLVVGLLADEGTPAAAAGGLADNLGRVLSAELSDTVDWEVKLRTSSLALDEQGRIPMAELADDYRHDEDLDLVVLLTDLPRRAGTQPIVSDFNSRQGVALLSVPALGAIRVKSRTRDLLVHLIRHLSEDRLQLSPECERCGSGAGLVARLEDLLAPTRHVDSDDDDVDQHLALRGARGRLRLLAGMVRDNRPWRLVPHLSTATAAAAATAAYGLVTTSFWNMANALSPWRLALINVVAILSMTVWLIYYNHLWSRPQDREEREKAFLDNVSTLVTLIIGVSCMYLILYALTLLAAAAVIDSGYLQSQIRRPVDVGKYATITWLITSVGIVAGALGSSLESDEAVRKATYSGREQERRRRRDDSGQDGQRRD
jgi:heme/copper-type cytochrome/quinol oxidase subunit 4